MFNLVTIDKSIKQYLLPSVGNHSEDVQVEVEFNGYMNEVNNFLFKLYNFILYTNYYFILEYL